MSDSDEDDQRKAECTHRMWVESQPGPSRCQPSRQGYCGYCRVLYNNLDQHLSSLRHLDSVRASSRGSSVISSTSSSRTKLTLLERFLQDVLQHHPHCYSDPRPTHADLPSISAPPLPRAELDEVCVSDDSRSLGTREHLPSSEDASCQPANRHEDGSNRSHSGANHSQQRLSAPIREQEEGEPTPTGHTCSPQTQVPLPQTQAPPPVHGKAHRKTNRRKNSDSSSLPPPSGPGPGTGHLSYTEVKPCVKLSPSPSPGPSPKTPQEMRPWLSWQKERREAQKEEAFSSDRSDPLDQTIEEVIQACCYGISSTPFQQEETESFHFSLPVSMETHSDDWDSPVQVVFQQAQTLSGSQPAHTPVQVSQTERQDLSLLMDVQVDLEDQMYSYQLDSALHSEQRKGGGARQGPGFWTLPIEEVLPAPAHIPESFRGKSWAQIEQEDEERVEKLVRQFRQGSFISYFDSESLARYGRRSRNKKGFSENKEAQPHTGVLPLLDQAEHDSVYVRRRKRRGFRMASRCQVVKVSHSTQTKPLVIPAVRPHVQKATPTKVCAVNQEAAERTPEVQTWRCLPSSYSNIITPVQPRSSLVYLLCSPLAPTSISTPVAGSTSKRCRRKRRPLDLQGLNVKYKRLPVRFYDPDTKRILKTPPKHFLWCRGPAPSSSPPPPYIRQLFRSLSPDLNTDRPLGEGPTGSPRAKGHKSAHHPSSHASSLHLSTLSRESGQTDKQDTVRQRGRTAKPPSPCLCRSERGKGRRKERTGPPPTTRRTRAQATPSLSRREGLRGAGPGRRDPGSLDSPVPPHPPLPPQGRARRGRCLERVRR
uniref:DBF4-type zinc finger-containing protein 2 n=1 Tax=Monopterus albus TaxID=43700 RepID=UPI0009B33527|nr:DBF4-type zinc finger-containing protein 2 [Monopterus albus]XP_020474789.1 DBF4-type zinc finger-containing protein 2 [Monopterus albus]